MARPGRREVRGERPVDALPEPDQDPGGEAGLGFRQRQAERVTRRVAHRLERETGRWRQDGHGRRVQAPGRPGPPEVLAVAIVIRRRPQAATDLHGVAGADRRERRQRRGHPDGTGRPGSPTVGHAAQPRHLVAVPRGANRLHDRRPRSRAVGEGRDRRRRRAQEDAQREQGRAGAPGEQRDRAPDARGRAASPAASTSSPATSAATAGCPAQAQPAATAAPTASQALRGTRTGAALTARR